jgi:glycerol-3-phosphate dehydrogenase
VQGAQCRRHALDPRNARLTGGDLSGWIGASDRPDTDIVRFEQALAAHHPELDARLRQRWTHAHGALGVEVAPGLFEAELHYLHDHEWARSADDVLWRRSKLGLHLDAVQREAVDRRWRNHFAADSEHPQGRASPARPPRGFKLPGKSGSI